MGYAGGTTPRPTYDSIGDHTETLQIDYDPEKIRFEDILEIFWKDHNPTERPYSAQYKAVLFHHDEEQKRLALESRDRVERELGRKVTTEVRPYDGFTRAEDYHQKYYLRGNGRVFREVRDKFRDEAGFIDSTIAARINGYIGGFGTRKELEAEIDTFGLGPEARRSLSAEVRR